MPIAQNTITHAAVSSLPLEQLNPPPETSPVAETPNALAIAELANTPVSSPPDKPANPCVYTTPSVSSTLRNGAIRLR